MNMKIRDLHGYNKTCMNVYKFLHSLGVRAHVFVVCLCALLCVCICVCISVCSML